MDPVTHILSGVALVRGGAARRGGRRGAALLIMAALFPDIDILLLLKGPLIYLTDHRGITHSLIGLVAFPPLLALPFAGGEWRRIPRLTVIAALGMVCHVFLDLITSWGTMVLYPWSLHRYSLDWVFIVDLVLTLLLLVPLIVGRGRLRPARWALLLAGLYILLGAVGHAAALATGRRLLAREGMAASQLDAFPRPLIPQRWAVLAKSRGTTYRLLLPEAVLQGGGIEEYQGSPADGLVGSALRVPEVQAFLTIARYPHVIRRAEGGHWVIEVRDLKNARNEMSVAVEMDGRGEVSGVSLFGRRTRYLH